MQRILAVIAGCALAIFFSVGVFAEPQYGGTFVLGGEGELNTLDNMSPSHSGSAQQMGLHIFETLFTYDNDNNTIPMLVDTYSIEKGGLELHMTLRQGVRFHNGDTMDSQDVVASFLRWVNYSSNGKGVLPYFDRIEVIDDYNVVIYFTQVYAPIMSYLANSQHACNIIPAEIAVRYDGTQLAHEDYVGTGPYKFAEWIPNQYILLVRFDEYSRRSGDPDGWGGARYAYFDAIKYVPIPDMQTKLAALEVGEVHYVPNTPADLWSQIDAMASAYPFAVRERGYNHLFLNTAEGICANQKIRQAILAALDMEEILIAAYKDSRFYEATGYYYPEGSIWHSMAGVEFYNQHDVARAQELMREAGYNGETLRYLTTRQYVAHYDQAVIIHRQLQEAGFNVELKLFDWATVGQLRNDKTVWDMYFTRGIGYVPEPLSYTWMSPGFAGWWDSAAKRQLVDAMATTLDATARATAYHQFQSLMYDEVPWVMTGKFAYTGGQANSVEAYYDWRSAVFFFWNMWFTN